MTDQWLLSQTPQIMRHNPMQSWLLFLHKISKLSNWLFQQKTRNCCGVMSCKINVGPCSILAWGEHRNKTPRCSEAHFILHQCKTCSIQNWWADVIPAWYLCMFCSMCCMFGSDVTLRAAYGIQNSSFITFNWLSLQNRVLNRNMMRWNCSVS